MRAMAKEGSREQESAKVEDPKKTSPAVENPLAQGRGGVHARMSNAAAQDRLRELTGAATEKGGEEENGKSGPEGDAGGITTAGPPPAAPPAAKPADSKPDVDATAKVEAKTAVEADPKPADGKAGGPPVDGKSGGPPADGKPSAAPASAKGGAPTGAAPGRGGAASSKGGASPKPVGGPTGGGSKSASASVGTGDVKIDTPSGDPEVGEMYALWTGRAPQQHAQAVQQAVTMFDGQASTGRAETSSHAAELGGKVDAGIEARVGQLEAAHAQAVSSLRAGFATARTQVAAGAAAALASIDARAVSTRTAIDASLTTQLAAVGSAIDGENTRLEKARADTLAAFNTAFDKGIAGVRAAGEAKGKEAAGIGEAYANGFEGRGGEGIDLERNQARAKAARQVAADYARGLRDEAGKIASELEGGRATLPDQVSQIVDPTAEGLRTQKAEATTQLTQAAESAKAEVESQRAASASAVQSSRAQTEAQLTSEEASSVADLGARAAQAQASLHSLGGAMKAGLQTSEMEVNTRFDELLAKWKADLGGELPDAREVEAIHAEAEVTLEGERALCLSEMDKLVDAGFTQVDAELASAVKGLTEAGTGAGEIAVKLAESASDSMAKGAASFGDAASQMSGTIGTRFGEAGKTIVEGARKSVAACIANGQTAATKTGQQLDSTRTKVEGAFTTALGKTPGEINKKAEEEAQKIQPAWKKILSVVVAIVVAIAVTAFVIATFGGGLLVFALAGAAASIAGKVAYDASLSLTTLSNQFGPSLGQYLLELVQVGVIGGLFAAAIFTLGMSGGALAGAGALTKLGVVVGTSFVGSLFDQGTDMLFFGEGWNTSEFMANGIFGVVTMGLALLSISAAQRLNTTLSNALLKGPSSNTWNNFLHNFSRIPGLSKLITSPSARSPIYQVVKRASGSAQTVEAVVDVVVNQLPVGITDKGLTSAPTWTADPDKGQSQIGAVANGSGVGIEKVAVPENLGAQGGKSTSGSTPPP